MDQDCHQKLIPGCYYHIYNRGNNKEILFKESDNYYYFLRLWWRHITPVAKTYCYNLLPNHFHFFIKIEDDVNDKAASKALSNLFNAYAKAINKKYERTGSLFQERFKRKEIKDDNYFTYIIFYILTNATKHGVCNSVDIYEYSAFKPLLSNERTRLMREEVFNWFSDKATFIEMVKKFDREIRPNRSYTC